MNCLKNLLTFTGKQGTKYVDKKQNPKKTPAIFTYDWSGLILTLKNTTMKITFVLYLVPSCDGE